MVNQTEWIWPNFKPGEVLSPEGLDALLHHHILLYNPKMLDCLEALRLALDRPVLVNHGGLTLRGYRSSRENRDLGGAWQSLHLLGLAADCTVGGISPAELAERAEAMSLFSGIGVYPDRGFVHLDIRNTTDGIVQKWKG